MGIPVKFPNGMEAVLENVSQLAEAFKAYNEAVAKAPAQHDWAASHIQTTVSAAPASAADRLQGPAQTIIPAAAGTVPVSRTQEHPSPATPPLSRPAPTIRAWDLPSVQRYRGQLGESGRKCIQLLLAAKEDYWIYSGSIAKQMGMDDPRGLGPILGSIKATAAASGLVSPVQRSRSNGKAILRLLPEFKAIAKEVIAATASPAATAPSK